MLYNGKRYDIGNKLEWLKANVELALRDEELGIEDCYVEVRAEGDKKADKTHC